MTKIDISEWKDFKLGYLIDDKTGEKTGTGLFAIINSTAYHSKDIEDYWISAIQDGNDWKYNTRQIINPNEHQSYQMPEKPFEIYEEDFIKTMMDFEMYKRGIDVKAFNDELMRKVLYSSDVSEDEKGTYIFVEGDSKDE